MDTYKDKDLELWQTWSKSRKDTDLSVLLQQLAPLIHAEVNRRAGTLSRDLLQLQAKILACKAISNFNPNLGVKLSTHLINQLQKLSRLNYSHANGLRVPEHTLLKYHTFMLATEDLQDQLGRPPTTEEMADELSWSPKKIEVFQQQFNHPELTESGDTPMAMFVAASHNPQLGYAYSSLSPRQQLIFEYVTGYNGTPRLSNDALLKKLGISQGVLSYEKTKIRDILRGIVK